MNETWEIPEVQTVELTQRNHAINCSECAERHVCGEVEKGYLELVIAFESYLPAKTSSSKE